MIYFDDGTITIRSMIPSDIDAIINGFKENSKAEAEKPRKVLELYFDEQSKSEAYIFVAEYDHSVAGYTALYLSAKEGPFMGKNIPEVSDFNVFAKFRRKGIGNTILEAAEKVAFDISDEKAVSLSVGLHSGYGSAQRIYFTRGYMPDGSGVWYKGKQLEQYADCCNDDCLNLYLIKMLKSR